MVGTCSQFGVALANLGGGAAGGGVAQTQLPEIVRTPAPQAAIGLQCKGLQICSEYRGKAAANPDRIGPVTARAVAQPAIGVGTPTVQITVAGHGKRRRPGDGEIGNAFCNQNRGGQHQVSTQTQLTLAVVPPCIT